MEITLEGRPRGGEENRRDCTKKKSYCLGKFETKLQPWINVMQQLLNCMKYDSHAYGENCFYKLQMSFFINLFFE